MYGCNYCGRFVRKRTDADFVASFGPFPLVIIIICFRSDQNQMLFYDGIAGMWSLFVWLPSPLAYALNLCPFAALPIHPSFGFLLQNNLERLQFLRWNNGSQCSDRIFLGMSFHVFGEMIAAHKRFCTNIAYETLFTRMRTFVT